MDGMEGWDGGEGGWEVAQEFKLAVCIIHFHQFLVHTNTAAGHYRSQKLTHEMCGIKKISISPDM